MSEESTVPGKALSLADLVEEFELWQSMDFNERDESKGYKQLALIYKFAIAHYEDPNIDLLLTVLERTGAEVHAPSTT